LATRGTSSKKHAQHISSSSFADFVVQPRNSIV
jgi:hypothetical protein